MVGPVPLGCSVHPGREKGAYNSLLGWQVQYVNSPGLTQSCKYKHHTHTFTDMHVYMEPAAVRFGETGQNFQGSRERAPPPPVLLSPMPTSIIAQGGSKGAGRQREALASPWVTFCPVGVVKLDLGSELETSAQCPAFSGTARAGPGALSVGQSGSRTGGFPPEDLTLCPTCLLVPSKAPFHPA